MASIALKRTDSFSSASGSNSNHQQLNAADLGYGDHHHPRSGGAHAGLYGRTLATLQYQPHAPSPMRGPSAYNRQDSEQTNLGYGYGGDGDDLSLVGECDVSSIRSDKNRPGRRASLSAAIELTSQLPKRNVSGGSRPRGRRNSLFGNNNKSHHTGEGGEEDESFTKPARSKSGGSVLSKIGRRASMGAPAEALKGAQQPSEPEPTPQFFHKRKGGTPRRKGSHDKTDTRAQHLTSQMRPGEKIKRPKNRRASMSAVPLGETQSDDEDEEFLTRAVPPRSSSYGNPRNRYKQEPEVDEYGYEIDPQLPPPPSGSSKRALQNRRGSTGTGLAAFVGSSWNKIPGRRGSTASSVATSNVTDTTDLASNQRNMSGSSSYYYQQHPQLQRKRSDSPEPDLLGTPQSTPQQAGKSVLRMPQGLTLSPSQSENPTPVQSNRKVRDGVNNASLSGTFGDSSALLDDMSLGTDSAGGSHQKDDKNDPLSMRRSSARTQRASLVHLDKPLGGGGGGAGGGGPPGRGSILGFNPYGNKAFGHSESEESESEDDDDDDDEDDNNANELKHESKQESNSTPPEEAPKGPDEEKPNAPALPTMEASPNKKDSQTSGKLTAGALAATNGTVTTEDDDDNHSNGSMTSEAPQEGIPKVSQEDEIEGIEEIGASGDWSQGVQDYMYQSTQRTKKNSLLDRYPGSVDDDEYLGYGYASKDPMNAFDNESERKDGGDIADLYAEDYSALTWRERQARTLDTMEFIDMEKMSKAKNTKGLYLPTFIPAHGCANASDFIVRCFVARLRAGVTVTKHSKSRWAKSHDRIIHILPTGYHITWIPTTEEEAIAKGTKKAPTKLDLTKCLEVRHAWSRDPKAKRYTGTATLRSKCKEGTANRSFALIYRDRTIDFTARTVDQCKILMEGFSALCFRLQMAKLEQQANDDDTHATGVSGIEIDDDSTTASLTTTNLSAPWGL